MNGYVEEVARLYREGMKPHDIAEKIGKSATYVYCTLYRLRKRGAVPKPNRRPPKPGKNTPLSFTLGEQDVLRLREYADRNGMTVSEVVRKVVQDHLDGEGGK